MVKQRVQVGEILVPFQGGNYRRAYLALGIRYTRSTFSDSYGTYRYLYTLYLAIDANFKLKGKSRGISDVELMPGWALFVEEEEYQHYLADYVDQPEVSALLLNLV